MREALLGILVAVPLLRADPKKHAAGLDGVSYALQTIQRLRNSTITDEHLDNV